MTENKQNRSRLIRKLSKSLIVSTPLVVAAFSVTQIANAQSVNCPAGSKLSSDGFCMVTSTYEAPTSEATGEAEAGSSYKAQPEATGEAEGSTYKATGEAEALKPQVRRKPSLTIAQLIKQSQKPQARQKPNPKRPAKRKQAQLIRRNQKQLAKLKRLTERFRQESGRRRTLNQKVHGH